MRNGSQSLLHGTSLTYVYMKTWVPHTCAGYRIKMEAYPLLGPASSSSSYITSMLHRKMKKFMLKRYSHYIITDITPTIYERYLPEKGEKSE